MASIWDFLPAFIQSRIPGVNVPPIYAENGAATFMPRGSFAPPIPRADGPMGMEDYRHPDTVSPETAAKYDDATRIRVNKPTWINQPPVPSATTSAPPMMGDANTLPAINSVPYSQPPAPATPTASTRKPFDWGADANIWPMLMAAGQGMMQPTLYGTAGALSQGLAGATEAAQRAPMQKLQKRMLEAQVGETEAKGDIRKQASEIAKSLPANHPARGFFALGLVEKGLEKLTPDWNQLIVVGPDGQPKLNETLVRAKQLIAASQQSMKWGVVGKDKFGRDVYGYPPLPGMAPSSPGATSSAPPSATVPTQGPPPAAIPTQATPGAPQAQYGDPPPNVDPQTWYKKQAERAVTAEQRAASERLSANVTTRAIDSALDQIKNQDLRTGLAGSLTGLVPGTGAYNLDETLKTVRANVGFAKLQQMRESSPTGGALGQVSDFENRLLQSVMGSLAIGQSKEQLVKNLMDVKRIHLAIVHRGIKPGEEKDLLDGKFDRELGIVSPSTGKAGTLPGGIKYREVR